MYVSGGFLQSLNVIQLFLESTLLGSTFYTKKCFKQKLLIYVGLISEVWSIQIWLIKYKSTLYFYYVEYPTVSR